MEGITITIMTADIPAGTTILTGVKGFISIVPLFI
jgi:hypothetical protein